MTVPSGLVFKKALCHADIKAYHLSHFLHPYSDTKIGAKVLNPVITRIEMRYLADRCIITPDGAGPAIRKMIDRLSRNEVVSITALAPVAQI
jgi:hypothetical protein